MDRRIDYFFRPCPDCPIPVASCVTCDGAGEIAVGIEEGRPVVPYQSIKTFRPIGHPDQGPPVLRIPRPRKKRTRKTVVSDTAE